MQTHATYPSLYRVPTIFWYWNSRTFQELSRMGGNPAFRSMRAAGRPWTITLPALELIDQAIFLSQDGQTDRQTKSQSMQHNALPMPPATAVHITRHCLCQCLYYKFNSILSEKQLPQIFLWRDMYTALERPKFKFNPSMPEVQQLSLGQPIV